MKPIIECVPNFSEGNDLSVIKEITNTIEQVEGVKLIDVDPGKATNRTVVTFVGSPEAVCEAAFLAVKKAGECIDMTRHTGAHPRFGATDVCPLVPVANITMDEVVAYAHKLAQRIGDELNIPVYCYEYAAKEEKRHDLAACRQGEYEALPHRLSSEEWSPDYGPSTWSDAVAHTGATAVGARNVLIAYNVNLNTTSVRRANAVAFDVRERGRVKRMGDPLTGKVVTDSEGKKVYQPGLLKAVKGIGWYIKEYGIAQISMNLTDLKTTPLHKVFEVTDQQARARGLRVTGSELVGVVPLHSLLEAGRYFLKKQKRSAGVPDRELIRIAIQSMGLNELYPFDPNKKIIEYMLRPENEQKLIDKSVKEFADETSSESPAPGGGSVAALLGALGASLGTMVANLSAHKRGWDDRWETFSNNAERGMALQQQLLNLVDEDTAAFNQILNAFKLSKKSDSEKELRTAAIQQATRYATEVPLKVIETTFKTFELLLEMAQEGNPASISDIGVGTLCARAAISGALLNVYINAAGLNDKKLADNLMTRAKEFEEKALIAEKKLLEIVHAKISK